MASPQVDIHDERQLQAAVYRNTRRIRVRQRAIQTLRKWRATRQAQLKKLRAQRQGSKRVVALKFLHDRIGWHEDAGRPNRAPWLDRWARDIGDWMLGAPWCGLTVFEAANAAGVALNPQVVSTVYIRDAARKGTGGFKEWHDKASGYQPQPGDVAIYGTGSPEHTGMYAGNGIVYEGNTSPGSGGSQNNGGGLYARKLSERQGWLLGWAIIDWENAR